MFENLTGSHKPDILDCLSNLSSDEVFTPPAIANQVLDLLPSEVWSNQDLKWLDPCCKSGVFLREAAKRLMTGLENKIPDEQKRREHIFKNMLYGLAITELTGLISRRSVYYSKDATSDYSILEFETEHGNILYQRGKHHYVNKKCWHCGAPVGSLDRGEHLENYAYSFIHDNRKANIKEPYALEALSKDMKFDVIIGNPPYQLQDAGDSTGASPIYHRFVEQAKKLDPRYISFIIPSRWFAGGKGLDKFREDMLSDRRIKNIVDYHDAADAFPGVEIKGGICYFLWDKGYDGDCEITPILNNEARPPMKRSLSAYDVFIRFNESVSILEKVLAKGDESFSDDISRQKPFGFRTNFKAYKKESFPGAVTIYANKAIGYIERDSVEVNPQWIDKHKVILSRSYNGGYNYPHQIINKPIVCDKGSCCTETYIVCGIHDDKKEAENLSAYIKTRFFRFMVFLRKITQDNPRDRFLYVPKLDMSIRWTDEMLYERYGISLHEQKFIESMIREMP